MVAHHKKTPVSPKVRTKVTKKPSVRLHRLALFFAVVGAVGLLFGGGMGIAWGVAQQPTSAQTATQLSTRTQEFIHSQRASGTSWLNTTNLDERTFAKSANNLQVQTECFAFELSLSASHLRQRDGQPCVVEAKLQPSGMRMVVSATAAAEIDELSGVQLRRSQPEVYTEERVQTPFGESPIFFGPKDVTVYALNEEYLFTMGISDFAQPESITPDLLQALLTGIEV
jgi:hypothetical protein